MGTHIFTSLFGFAVLFAAIIMVLNHPVKSVSVMGSLQKDVTGTMTGLEGGGGPF